jgi:hypothetical protein
LHGLSFARERLGRVEEAERVVRAAAPAGEHEVCIVFDEERDIDPSDGLGCASRREPLEERAEPPVGDLGPLVIDDRRAAERDRPALAGVGAGPELRPERQEPELARPGCRARLRARLRRVGMGSTS